MKALIMIFSLACSVAYATESDVAGAYRQSNGTQMIRLALLQNGNYLAHWSLDIFPDNGSASGTWRIEGDEVHLTPKKEDGALKGHLSILLVRVVEGRQALLRKEDAKFEGNPFFYFYRKEKPNQPVETTATRAAVVRMLLLQANAISPSLAVLSHL